ncbi:uncharacterized protein LOC111340642 [Stylophora pistillata]|uniref:uncharacterized protein LOC111340642 n=1 Tax=Stylophora pistillata TaxID=50429 RepID=UPI000C045A04|nr:uncharacterized protein LOC111340642 [Stylophora pistillata]
MLRAKAKTRRLNSGCSGVLRTPTPQVCQETEEMDFEAGQQFTSEQKSFQILCMVDFHNINTVKKPTEQILTNAFHMTTLLRDIQIYSRENHEECQTLKSTLLIDEIEQTLDSKNDYQACHQYIFDVIPEFKEFLKSHVVSTVRDWPT